MHTMWYLRYEKTAGWRCRACDSPRKWVSTKCKRKSLWFGDAICYQCHGVRYRLWVSDWIVIGAWINCDCDWLHS